MKINDNCIICGTCAENCPSEAIEPMQIKGKGYARYEINQKKCSKCGLCLTLCDNAAVYDETKIND